MNSAKPPPPPPHRPVASKPPPPPPVASKPPAPSHTPPPPHAHAHAHAPLASSQPPPPVSVPPQPSSMGGSQAPPPPVQAHTLASAPVNGPYSNGPAPHAETRFRVAVKLSARDPNLLLARPLREGEAAPPGTRAAYLLLVEGEVDPAKASQGGDGA